MTNIQFPSSFVKLLCQLEPVFTKPSFRYFKAIIFGILFARPKKTVTAAVKLAGLERRFSNVNRFISHYRWNAAALGMAMLQLVLKTLGITIGPLTLALDSTFLTKFGSSIFGCGFHFNHARKNNLPNDIWGHDWLVMGLLYRSSLFDKWICFPFLAHLFVPEKYLPRGQTYRSSIEIACDMINNVCAHIKQQLILVTDGFFAKTRLLKTCIQQGVTVISRMQSNAALYYAPKQSRRKKRGRPPRYGRRMNSLKQLARAKPGFEQLELKLYGKKRSLRVKQIQAMWKPAGQLVLVLIVFYEHQKKPVFFFTTDMHMSIESVLTRIAARWSLENLFKDIKEHLGWSHWQCRVEKAVRRSATLTCAAASLLLLWSHEHATQKQPEFWDVLPWYSKKATPSFKDILEPLRCRVIDQIFYTFRRPHATMAEKKSMIRDILRLAA